MVDDPEGQELLSLEEALQNAELSLCEIAGDALRVGENVHLKAIVITNETATSRKGNK